MCPWTIIALNASWDLRQSVMDTKEPSCACHLPYLHISISWTAGWDSVVLIRGGLLMQVHAVAAPEWPTSPFLPACSLSSVTR